jgi:hypothetical protein
MTGGRAQLSGFLCAVRNAQRLDRKMLPVSGLIHGEFPSNHCNQKWGEMRDSQVISNISSSTSPEVMAEKSSMLRETFTWWGGDDPGSFHS